MSWVMLTKSTDHRWWAQVGWWEDPNDKRYTFTQHTDAANHWITWFWTAKPVNTYTDYTVRIDGTTFHFYAAGVLLLSAADNFTVNEAQAFGETHTLASQMPGAAQNLERFNGTWILYGGAWINMDPTVWTTNNTYFTATKVNSATINIRDKACTGS